MARLALRRVMDETDNIIPIWWDRQPGMPSPGAEERYSLYGGDDNAYAAFGGELLFSDYQCNYFSFIESYDYYQNHTSPVVIDLQFLHDSSTDFILEADITLDDYLLTEECKLFFVVTCDSLRLDPDERVDAEWSYRVLANSEYYDFELVETGQSATYNQTFQIPELEFIEMEDYHAIALIQDMNNGKIIQAKRVILGTYLDSEDEIYASDISLSNYPNPFNPETTISFSIEQYEPNQQIEIEIYNIKGEKIRTLCPHFDSAQCENSVIWNGTDQNLDPVSSGIYLYKLLINGKTKAVNKGLLLK